MHEYSRQAPGLKVVNQNGAVLPADCPQAELVSLTGVLGVLLITHSSSQHAQQAETVMGITRQQGATTVKSKVLCLSLALSQNLLNLLRQLKSLKRICTTSETQSSSRM